MSEKNKTGRQSLYKKFKWYKKVQITVSEYTYIPGGGAVDFDRLISGKPPFENDLDGAIFQKKKLVIDDIIPPSGLTENDLKFWKWRVVMIFRTLIENGFELYRYRKDMALKLTCSNLSSFLFKKLKTVDLYDNFIRHVNIAADDAAVVSKESIDQLELNFKFFESDTLWRSDLVALHLCCQDIRSSGYKFKKYIKNTLIKHLFDKDVELAKHIGIELEEPEIAHKAVTKKLRGDKLTEFEKELISTAQYSIFYNEYDSLIKMSQQSDHPFLNELLATKQHFGQSKLFFFAEQCLDKYNTLLDTLIESQKTLPLKIALEAKNSDNASALSFLAYKEPEEHLALLYKLMGLTDSSLLRIALGAKNYDNTFALFLLANKKAKAYCDLLDELTKLNYTQPL